jgi:uncharacterized protein
MKSRSLNPFRGVAILMQSIAFSVCVASGMPDANAASFDCAKASTFVEKSICSDPELSGLDEALNQAYLAAREAPARREEVRNEQLRWIGVRNACASPACIRKAYLDRIESLEHMAPLAHSGTQKPTEGQQKSTKQLCDQVASALKQERSPTQPKPLFVDSIDAGGRSWMYQGVDLDRDGKPDDLLQSCGSPGDGRCTLQVTLSSGGSYEVSEEIFKVIRFQSKHYVVVGDSFPPERVGFRRLYLLTVRGANLVCTSF